MMQASMHTSRRKMSQAKVVSGDQVVAANLCQYPQDGKHFLCLAVRSHSWVDYLDHYKSTSWEF